MEIPHNCTHIFFLIKSKSQYEGQGECKICGCGGMEGYVGKDGGCQVCELAEFICILSQDV